MNISGVLAFPATVIAAGSNRIANTYHSLSPLAQTALIAGISSAATVYMMPGLGEVAASVASYAASSALVSIPLWGAGIAGGLFLYAVGVYLGQKARYDDEYEKAHKLVSAIADSLIIRLQAEADFMRQQAETNMPQT